MKEYDLNRLISNPGIVDNKIKEFLQEKILKKQEADSEEIEGHILKSENNLRFISENIKLSFYDWAITGCYYACYHAALALILSKGYSSKNHLASLCILIKEFYRKELTKEDIELFSCFLDYTDVMLYVEAKNKREDATYSTKTKFEKKEVENLRVKAVMFISKIKTILKSAR